MRGGIWSLWSWNAGSSAQDGLISQVPNNQLGMKVLYEGSQVEVDIVAVHGLGAIPDITWREKQSQVNWLQDVNMLPCAVPNSRIMRFGYDSLFLCRNPVRTSTKTIADNLLAALQGDRENCQSRPLIFIGHCFGGLVIQKALTLDHLESNFKHSSTLLSVTAGIIFLGTPHSGTVTFTNEGVSHSTIMSLLAASSDLRLDGEVLKSLESPHHTLTDISNEFLRLCSKFSAVVVINFFEQRSSKVGKLYGRNDLEEFVVGEASATLGHYPSYGLPLDHYSLNKFASPVDGNFVSVLREIKHIYNLVLRNVQIPNTQTMNMQTLDMQTHDMQTLIRKSFSSVVIPQLPFPFDMFQCSSHCHGLVVVAVGVPITGVRPPPPSNKTSITFRNESKEPVQIFSNGRVVAVATLRPAPGPSNERTLPATAGQTFRVQGQDVKATKPPILVIIPASGNRAVSNNPGTRLYPLAHNRDVSGLRSIDGRTATSITFVNETTTDVNVDWINYGGQRQRYCTLKPGESYRQETFVGHPWEVVAGGRTTRFLPTARAEYNAVIGSTDNPTLICLQTCESENLRSMDGAATSINFFNGSNCDANIFWINHQGKRQLYKTLKPGEVYHQHTHVNHPWEVVAGQDTTRYMPIDSEVDVCIE